MSIGLQLTIQGDDAVEQFFARMMHPDWEDLLDQVGGTIVDQTQVRIAKEKASATGEPWEEWSAKYARTRHGGHSLLQGNNDLLNSINHQVVGQSVEVGSHLVYAAHHQFGSEKTSGRGSGVPARPYLGISADNCDKLEEIIAEWVQGMMDK